MNRDRRPAYIIVVLLFILGFVKTLITILSRGEFLNSQIYNFSNMPLFYDFYNHVRVSMYEGNIYETGQDTCFPALAYLFYKAVAAICRVDNPDKEIIGSNSFTLVLILFYGTVFGSFVLLLVRHLQDRLRISTAGLLALLLIPSSVFITAICSGNITIAVLCLILAAFVMKDSDSPLLREGALILIAVAAAFKIYPAVFGALYLVEKRYKEALLLILHGLAAFFLPFVFFDGLYGFRLFLHNIMIVGSGYTGITIFGICKAVFGRFFTPPVTTLIGRSAGLFYLCLVLFLLFYIGRNWKATALLTSLMIIFNQEAGSYCLIYWAIALVCFLKEAGTGKDPLWKDTVYAVLFALFFGAFPIPGMGGASSLNVAVLYLMVFMIILDLLLQMIRQKKAAAA